MIPSHLHSLFWDVDTANFDPAAYPQYTIGRILEYGDQEAVAWLKGAFSADTIKHVVRVERRLSSRSATFWALVYDIPEGDVAALRNKQ